MFDIHTLKEEMNAALVQHLLIALLSIVFGALALVLASIGLYGLMAFTAVQRTPEIGIRVALGARRANVVWLVMSALVLAAMGVTAGVLAALVAARLASSEISGLLFRLRATDPITIAVAASILVSVAALATYLPARRASHVDPNTVLRSE
jgi:ABC-type antimicrobial peptide transport system permease subunit